MPPGKKAAAELLLPAPRPFVTFPRLLLVSFSFSPEVARASGAKTGGGVGRGGWARGLQLKGPETLG